MKGCFLENFLMTCQRTANHGQFS